jgi:hypothetical protein
MFIAALLKVLNDLLMASEEMLMVSEEMLMASEEMLLSILVLLDFSKVFDCVDHILLCAKLASNQYAF